MPPDIHALRPALQTVRDFTSLARKFQILAADQAAGRCLSVSLEFALAARRQLGAEVQLVKWRVRDDPAYLDHWAVLLDNDTVVDLTHVQVDGSTKLVCRVTDYPSNYVNRCVYPAALLSAAYAARQAPHAARLSDGFLWTCGTRLLGHDLRASLRSLHGGRAVAALREFATFLACFAFGVLTRALERRASRLLGRLRPHADVSARTAFGDLSEFEPAGASGFGALTESPRAQPSPAREPATRGGSTLKKA